jgi:hypothetical protein
VVIVTELVDASVRFPTVIFTIGLGIALIYWAFVLLGALGVDLLGGGDAADAGKAIGDLAGAGKVVGDVAGAGKAIDGDALGHDGGLLGLGRVPLTISISLVLLACWCLSLLGMHYGTSMLGDTSLVSLLVLVLAVAIALPIASLLVRPLVPVFAVREGKSNRDYIGHLCTVSTGHVDEQFGQATVEDGGTVLVIHIRCDKPGALARGSKALIVDFDDARQAYIVEPASDLVSAPSGSES